jgi:hypothetical protein
MIFGGFCSRFRVYRRRIREYTTHMYTTPDSQSEVRAGKKELKERWGIRTFDDVDRIIGDVVRHALDEVRYLAPSQGDSNVTRQRLDPISEATRAQVERGLFDFRAGYCRTI